MQKSRASQMVLLAWIFFRVLGRCCDGKGLQDFATILFPCFPCAVPDSDVGPTPRPMVPPCCFLPRDLRHTATRLYLSIGLQPPAGPKTAANPATPATSKMAPAPSSGIRFCSVVVPLPVCLRSEHFVFLFFRPPFQFTTHSRSQSVERTPTVFLLQHHQPGPLGGQRGIVGWTPDTATSLASCSLLSRTGTRS